jgi:hypothetical protein
MSNNTLLWRKLEEAGQLTHEQKIQKTAVIVERRSKGKLMFGVDRLTRELLTIRKIYLDVTNAG